MPMLFFYSQLIQYVTRMQQLLLHVREIIAGSLSVLLFIYSILSNVHTEGICREMNHGRSYQHQLHKYR